MKLNLEIDEDIADDLVRDVLIEHVEILNRNIKLIKKQNNLQNYQKIDLLETLHMHRVLTEAANYFGSNVK